MFTLEYTQKFKRQIKKLPISIAKDFFAIKGLLEENPFNPSLKTHKLGGNLRPYWSASINYEYRVIFRFEGKQSILLITIGNHEIYKEVL